MENLGYNDKEKLWKGVCGVKVECNIAIPITLRKIFIHMEECNECNTRWKELCKRVDKNTMQDDIE